VFLYIFALVHAEVQLVRVASLATALEAALEAYKAFLANLPPFEC